MNWTQSMSPLLTPPQSNHSGIETSSGPAAASAGREAPQSNHSGIETGAGPQHAARQLDPRAPIEPQWD